MSGRWVGEEASRGQATIEVVLTLPLIAMLIMFTVQIAVVARNEVLVVHAAREAARAAAVSEDDPSGSAWKAATGAGSLDADRMRVEVNGHDDLVTVEVSFTDPTDVVLVGALLPDVRHRATVTMRREASSG